MRRNFPYLAVWTLVIGWALSPADARAQFRYPLPYPYGGYQYARESNLRIDVTPREAAVYVDGYFAGYVDEFDGVFQRLHVTPGEHEIVIYLQGYRSLRERLYLGPNTTRKIERAMDRQAPGEPPEPVPQPTEGAAGLTPTAPVMGRPMPGRGQRTPPPERVPRPTGRLPDAQGGTLLFRVQPSDAGVLVDGERWRGPTGSDRLVVQVSEGRHRIEITKEGYQPFTTEIEVRGGESVPLNVSLPPIR